MHAYIRTYVYIKMHVSYVVCMYVLYELFSFNLKEDSLRIIQ